MAEEPHQLIARAKRLAVTEQDHAAIEHHAKYLNNAIHNLWSKDERREREWFENSIAQRKSM